MTTFICLKAGKAFGPEYVNILRDMVLRNLAESVIDRFVCITDDDEGLDAGIEVMPLPADLTTWWGKLYMFKKGLFPDGERMVFMDLDTVITGRLDDIFSYRGEFAALRGFLNPKLLNSGVMLWEAGTQYIWEDWLIAFQPKDDQGDQRWIGHSSDAEYLQDLYPGKFVSYKVDCQVAPPSTAAVVCFHGVPRPHQVKGWVTNFWKIGGYSSAQFDVVCNTELNKIVENIRYSSSLPIKSLELKPANNHWIPILLCGGGPSLVDSLPEIRQRQNLGGAMVVALNGSAQFLKDNGIAPDWMVMIDARESNAKFVANSPAREYFISSQCAPQVFSDLDCDNVTVFHIDIPNIAEYVKDNGQSIQAVGGGSSVGLIAMSVAYTQGYRNMHLYGYDSSFRDDEGHAYSQNQTEEVIEADVNGRLFKTCPWMVTQATQWQQLAAQLRVLGCEITVHGDGLLPYLAWLTMMKERPSFAASSEATLTT